MPSRGVVGMACLILAESSIFIIFIVAYIYYLGKSITGPKPQDVLELPLFTSICLFSSSATVHPAGTSAKVGHSEYWSSWFTSTRNVPFSSSNGLLISDSISSIGHITH